MASVVTEPRPITIRREDDGRVVILDAEWPPVTTIADCLIRQSVDDRITLRYPLLIIRLDNARAVYRVDTLELGTWKAVLVEGHIEGRGRL
jgi:hypothetical protein